MTRMEAIHEFCKQCIYDEKSGYGTWRQQTEACTAKKCPLYAWRPKSAKEKVRGAGEIGPNE